MNEKERAALLQELSEKQRRFLDDNVKQLKCDLWVEKLAKLKGLTITDDMDEETLHKKIDEWILVDVLDGGYKQRPYKCVCGKSLRKQYILKNKSKDIKLKLGQECFKKHTKLDEKLINDIIRGFHKVNSELDEILNRQKEGLISKHIEYLLEPALTVEYRTQLDLGLPLSERQELKAKKLIEEYHQTIEEQKFINELKKVEEGLSLSQKEFIDASINVDDKYQLIIRLKNGDYIYKLEDIEGIEVSNIVEQKIRLELPLSHEEEKHIDFLQLMKRNMRSKKERFTSTILADKPIKKKTKETTIDYQSICNNHGQLIKRISDKQQAIPESLRKDWVMIEAMIKDTESGKKVPRRKFLLMLSNIATAIGMYEDVYGFYR